MGDRKESVFEAALKMEQRGYEHYQAFVKTCQNELGRELFATLRDDELVHIERIKKIHAAVLAGAKRWEPEFDVDDAKATPESLDGMFRAMYAKHGAKVTATSGDLEALDIGIDFELRAVKFYEGHLPHAVDDVERQFTLRMIDEERFHHKALVDTQLFLTNPDGWYRESEKGHLDGAN
jgi:rubrerythrin